MARSPLLVATLSIALVATLTGWYGGSALADDAPVASTTTLGVSDEEPAPGDTITLTATVSVDGVPTGQVDFRAAPTEDDLGSDDGATLLGTVEVVTGQGPGLASLQVTVDEEDLPFLSDAPDGFWVDARYQPDQTSEILPSASDPVFVTIVAAEPRATETTATGPASAVAGVGTTLAAVVDPDDAVGTVQFSVDDSSVGAPVSLVDGAASMPYTFGSPGDHTVRATFTPADPSAFGASADLAGRVVTVAPVPPPPPVPTATTTVVTAPDTATTAAPVELVASVTPVAAVGTVQFSVDGSPVGSPVPVSGGTASTSYRFATGGAHTVAGAFTPADSTYGASSGSDAIVVSAPPLPTTVEVSVPDRAVAGAKVSMTAAVTPRDVPGQVTFLVDGRIVGAVSVTDGTAAVSHRFVSIRTSKVTAVWRPDDASSYAPSTTPEHLVRVVPGTTAQEFGDFLAAGFSSLVLSTSCDGTRGGGAGVARDVPNIWTILITVLAIVFDVLRYVFQQLDLSFEAVRCGGGGGRGPADTVRGTVTCELTGTGLACPLDLEAFSRVTITGSLPVPTDLAGRRLELSSTLGTVDPQSGEVTPVDTARTALRVPRRTALSAHLTPRPSYVTSVRHGRAVTYRLAVRNPGVVTADRVRACVSVAKGARVASAPNGGRIHGRTACWTLPALTRDDAVVRSVVLVAPRTAGRLRVSALVRPRRSQADPVRLVAVLPVR